MPEELKPSFQEFLLDNIQEAVDRLRETGHENSKERAENLKAIQTALDLLKEL